MNNTVRKITNADLASLRARTDERINSIITTPNMDIPLGATVFYVSPNGNDDSCGTSPASPWQSLQKLNTTKLPQGSFVCFLRGGVWRGRLYTQNNVTYTAYGDGKKPVIMGSPQNGADPALWTPCNIKDLWKFHIGENDVGTLVFNDGELCAIKVLLKANADGTLTNITTKQPYGGLEDIKHDLHFYHDLTDGYVYLVSPQNPGERFTSIEFNPHGHTIASKTEVENVTIDNLCLKYCGSHAIGLINARGLTVQNCEFGWIGGSIQYKSVRYGNAVEVWESCDGYIIDNCYFYQIYDAAVTNQFSIPQSNPDLCCSMKNIRYSNNVMEYCNYSVEYFINGVWEQNQSMMDNFEISGNQMWYAGRGFCTQRPDRGCAAHIKSWTSTNHAKNYVVKDNLMCLSDDMLVHVNSVTPNVDGTDPMPCFYGNTVVGLKEQKFGMLEQSPSPTAKPYNDETVAGLYDKVCKNEFLFVECDEDI